MKHFIIADAEFDQQWKMYFEAEDWEDKHDA